MTTARDASYAISHCTPDEQRLDYYFAHLAVAVGIRLRRLILPVLPLARNAWGLSHTR